LGEDSCPSLSNSKFEKKADNGESFRQGYLFGGTIWGQPIHDMALDEHGGIPLLRINFPSDALDGRWRM